MRVRENPVSEQTGMPEIIENAAHVVKMRHPGFGKCRNAHFSVTRNEAFLHFLEFSDSQKINLDCVFIGVSPFFRIP